MLEAMSYTLASLKMFSVNIITYKCLRYTKIWIYTISIYTHISFASAFLYRYMYGCVWFQLVPTPFLLLLYPSPSCYSHRNHPYDVSSDGVCVCWHTSSLHLCQSTKYTHRSGTLIRILNVRQVHTYTHVPLSIRGSYDAITQWPWQADRISTKRRAIRHDFHLTLDMVFFLYFPASIGGHHHFSSGISLPSPCVPWSLLQLTFYQHSPAAHKLLQIRTQFKL